MANAQQGLDDFRGDHLSFRMLQAKGDVVTVLDAVMNAGSPILQSATAGFAPGDTGKLAIVVGAGAAGAILELTILSYTDGSHVVLSGNAGTNVAAAEMSFGTDDANALQAGFQQGNCLLPIGRYFCSKPITIQDLSNLHFSGRGPASIIIPTSVFTTQNFLNVKGSTHIDLEKFTIDGRYFPDVSQEIIIGDGTAANPIYGDISIHGMRFLNCRPIVIGIGATTGNTAQDITIRDNYFYNCSWGSFLPNTIDTGSTGTKLRYKINGNRFVFVNTSPGGAANSGVAIFAGHGTQTDTEIIGNKIWNAPIDAIQVFARHFALENVTMSGVQVKDNLIYHPGWAGIALYGGFNVDCEGNTVIFPGQQLDAAAEKRCAIYSSCGVTGAGSTNQHASNVKIHNNTLIGDGAGTSINGIFESTFPGPGVVDATGEISDNIITGQSGAALSVYGGFAIQQHTTTTGKFAFGKAASGTAAAALNVLENFQAQRATSGLFNEVTVLPGQAAGNFLLAYTLNAHFDGTNWISGFDGVSNGFSILACDYGANTMRFYVAPTTGGTAQTLSPAALEAFLAFTVNGAAFLKCMGAIGMTETVPPSVSVGGEFKMYPNSTTHVPMWSQNGSAYVAFGATSDPAWTAFTPTTANLTTVTSDCRELLSGKTAKFRIEVQGTTNGGGTNPTINLHTAPVSVNMAFACYITTGGVTIPGTVTIAGSTMTVKNYNNTAFAGTTVYVITIQGVYDVP